MWTALRRDMLKGSGYRLFGLDDPSVYVCAKLLHSTRHENHAPEKSRFANYIPQNKVSIL